jgi:hypothetical protein
LRKGKKKKKEEEEEGERWLGHPHFGPGVVQPVSHPMQKIKNKKIMGFAP